MGYKGDSCMDVGYFMGGDPRGLFYFPVDGSKPGIIPWSELLPDDEDEAREDIIDEEKYH